MLRGVIDGADEILSEIPWDEGVRILVLLPHGRLSSGHKSPIPYLSSLKTVKFNDVWVTPSAVASGSIEYFSIYICTGYFSFFVNIFTISSAAAVGVYNSEVAPSVIFLS